MKNEGTRPIQQPYSSSDNFNVDLFDNAPAAAPAKSAGPTVAQIAVAGVGGLVIGAVAMTLMSGKNAGEEPEPSVGEEGYGSLVGQLSDGEVEFADSVSDDMSFSQAFAAARDEVGAGGAFVWHGTVYGTYTAEEWHSMSEAERDAYSSHFTWDNIDRGVTREEQDTVGDDGTTDGVRDDLTGEEQPEERPEEQPEERSEEQPEERSEEQPVERSEEQPEEHTEEQPEEHTEGQPEEHTGEQPEELPADHPTDEPEVEVVEIVRDGEDGGYVALNIDGQEGYFVDVDGDGVLDTAIYDANGDGVIQEEEVVDVYEEGITFEDFSLASGVDIQDSAEDELYADDTLSDQDILDI